MFVIIAATGFGRVKVPRDIYHDAFYLQFHLHQLIRSMFAQEL
jgi:hypothetical protein